jgi:hypothetical protein
MRTSKTRKALKPLLVVRVPLGCAGYFPVRLEALPEGTVVHAHCPVYQARLPLQLRVC